MGRTMFEDFVKYCRTGAGYAALKSVVTRQPDDDMESFVFAETFTCCSSRRRRWTWTA